MRLYKTAHQEKWAIGIAPLQKLNAPVRHPGAVVQPLRKLRGLGNIVHLAAHPMGILHMPIAVLLQKYMKVIPGGALHLLADIPPVKAPQRGISPVGKGKVHLADAMGLIVLLLEPLHQTHSGLGHGFIVKTAALKGHSPGEHGISGGHAHRARCIGPCEGGAHPGQLVENRRPNDRIAVGAYGIKALLIGKQQQNVRLLHDLALL